MNNTTIMGDETRNLVIANCYMHLLIEKSIIQKDFDWLHVTIKGKLLEAKGYMVVDSIKYCVKIYYSPLLRVRMERITITNHKITYHDDIHVYGDLSLCLYHPVIDKPHNGIIPLHKMIPWITEWCHFYNQWKKYGVWLGREIKHARI